MGQDPDNKRTLDRGAAMFSAFSEQFHDNHSPILSFRMERMGVRNNVSFTHEGKEGLPPLASSSFTFASS